MARWPRLGIMSLIGALALLLGCSSDRPEIRVEPPPVSSTTVDESPPPPPSGVETTAPVPSTAPAVRPTTIRGHHVATVIAQYPHDPDAFTQGLEWYGEALLESTGRRGESTLRLVDPETGVPTLLVPAAGELFAEGITVVDGEAVQLTYQDNVLLRTQLPSESEADLATATDSTERIDDAYEGEGWGLCFDGTHLVMSNGTDELTFRDPETFEIERTVTVTLSGEPIDYINELECVGDQILANVWQTNSIIAISSIAGEITGSIDASGLVPAGYEDDNSAVLNGIAYNASTDTYWLTGKLWPVMYEVRFTPA